MVGDEAKKAAAGDPRMIEQLCSNYWEPLYRYIYFKVQNREEAEDITQETFVKTLAYWPEHEISRNNLPGFLKTVSQNIICDRWRQKKRRGASINWEDLNLKENRTGDEQTQITQRLQIESALAQLKPDQQRIIELRIIQGYSVAETARLTGKTEAAVRVSQYRALQFLARILENDSGQEG
ncbi:MAG: sigma-70 family RNA polymerase sigma factor [Syntrophomonadaceae bacterium]|nr:sigma-70 family RNA polymerase sigma factor [Syntrophomonadaceae bacterium]